MKMKVVRRPGRRPAADALWRLGKRPAVETKALQWLLTLLELWTPVWQLGCGTGDQPSWTTAGRQGLQDWRRYTCFLSPWLSVNVLITFSNIDSSFGL